jgi:hypothetical protein
MLFCPLAIDRYSDLNQEIIGLKKPIKCVDECDRYSRDEIIAGECPYAMHRGGNPANYIMEMKSSKTAGASYHFHLRCLLSDPVGKENIDEKKIRTYYPYVSGLEKLERTVQNKDSKILQLEKELKEKEDIIESLEERLKTGQQTLS